MFRVDNPHTKPVPFWEWLIAEVRARHPETVFLSEAFTRPVDDDAAREGRVLAVLHVLHVEEHEVGARGVRRAAPLLVDLPPPEPLAEHAGHPPRAPADRRPAGVREQARPRGDALADLRHLLRLRELRERPAPLRERGVPPLREVRAARAGARRAAPTARPAAERAAARSPRPDRMRASSGSRGSRPRASTCSATRGRSATTSSSASSTSTRSRCTTASA